MDRLLSLKKLEVNSSLNASTSSELGYETAQDSSTASLYFSVYDSSADDDTFNESDQLQTMANTVDGVSVPDLRTPLPRRSIGSTSSTETIEDTVISRSQSPNSIPTSTVPSEQNQTVVSLPLCTDSDVPLERNLSQSNELSANSELLPELGVSSIESNVNTGIATSQSAILDPRSTHHVAPSENVVGPILSSDGFGVGNLLPSNENCDISNIPLGPAVSTITSSVRHTNPNLPEVTISNGTHVSSSSTVLQGLYVNVVAINNQQINQVAALEQPTHLPIVNRAVRLQNHNPYQTRASRYTIVNFRTNEMPRGHTNMSRRTLRDIQNEAVPSAGSSNAGQPNISASKENHICNVCKKSFPLRSTLIVHQSCHQSKSSSDNCCKYCDRVFQKSIALSNHLKEKCEKIPAAARRILLTKEYNARK